MNALAPAHRPTCRNCGRTFRLFRVRVNDLGRPQPTRGIVFHHLDPTGFFCTQRCSTKYAVSAARGTTPP